MPCPYGCHVSVSDGRSLLKQRKPQGENRVSRTILVVMARFGKETRFLGSCEIAEKANVEAIHQLFIVKQVGIFTHNPRSSNFSGDF